MRQTGGREWQDISPKGERTLCRTLVVIYDGHWIFERTEGWEVMERTEILAKWSNITLANRSTGSYRWSASLQVIWDTLTDSCWWYLIRPLQQAWRWMRTCSVILQSLKTPDKVPCSTLMSSLTLQEIAEGLNRAFQSSLAILIGLILFLQGGRPFESGRSSFEPLEREDIHQHKGYWCWVVGVGGIGHSGLDWVS